VRIPNCFALSNGWRGDGLVCESCNALYADPKNSIFDAAQGRAWHEYGRLERLVECHEKHGKVGVIVGGHICPEMENPPREKTEAEWTAEHRIEIANLARDRDLLLAEIIRLRKKKKTTRGPTYIADGEELLADIAAGCAPRGERLYIEAGFTWTSALRPPGRDDFGPGADEFLVYWVDEHGEHVEIDRWLGDAVGWKHRNPDYWAAIPLPEVP